MNEIILPGCTPTPLANYLKALGVLRILGEQKDSEIRTRWQGEAFVINTQLACDELLHFFLNEYIPTPVIAPWNGGSGFYYQEGKLKEKDPVTGKRIKTGIRNQPTSATKTVDKILQGKAERFRKYRFVLSSTKSVLNNLGYTEAPKENEKLSLIQNLRGRLPEEVVSVIDTGVVLTMEKASYPSLVGTGWNDGNLDFTNNFMQRLTELFDSESGKPNTISPLLLDGALFGGSTPFMASSAVGQFSPGGVGGPNATAGYEGDSLVNPWDFVLMIEGALLFAAAATRRMESVGPQSLSYPFTVRATGSGSGGTAFKDEENARAEMWLPLWSVPAGYAEIRALMSEGRATLGRQMVRDGLDFSRAIAALAVDRGIDSFQRFAFLMRSGKAYLATPLNRFEVQRNSSAGVVSDLDKDRGWLRRLRSAARREEMPERFKSLVRQLEDAIFSLNQKKDCPEYVQQALMLLGEIQHLCGESPKVRDALRTPVPHLSEQWVRQADDGSAEFRLAKALAGLNIRENNKRLTMLMYVSPVAAEGPAWHAESRSAVWGNRDLARNLLNVLSRLTLDAEREGFQDKPLFSPSRSGIDDVAAFLNRSVDDQKIARLICGLALTHIPMHVDGPNDKGMLLPASYAMLKPLFAPDKWLRGIGVLRGDQHLPLPSGLIRRITNPATFDSGLRLARSRLRASGLGELPGIPSSQGLDISRLAASLLIPVNDDGLKTLCSKIGIQKNKQESEPVN